MKMRPPINFRSITLLFFVFLLISNAPGQLPEQIQLVESIPVQTTLGLPETARTFPVWYRMISAAEKSIDMEIFYLSDKAGTALDTIVQAMITAAGRGVQIRIIADDRMAKTYPETLDSLNNFPNIIVHRISLYDNRGGVMHAKYFIVDDREVFIGSQNMDWRALEHIHELGIRVMNTRLAMLVKQIFELDWQISGEADQTAPLSLPVLPEGMMINRSDPLRFQSESGEEVLLYPTFSSPFVMYPGMDWDQTEIVRLIDSAKTRAEIQLLSYSPVSRGHFFGVIDNAIREAAARGVQVHMILSNWNTRQPDIQYLKSLQVVPNIEIRISTIPQWSGGFIPFARVEHCKYLVVDSSLVWLGTSNWSYSYFNSSRNLGTVLQGEVTNNLVHRIFLKSWDSGYCKTLDVCRDYVAPDVSGGE
jgi:phosphatidylserine/phosphatidylglycerophosphate/cardiolipin synthase-like enzyme